MPNESERRLPVRFDGSEIGSSTAVIDFDGLEWDLQMNILASIRQAKGIKFSEIYENGRQIVLKFSHTHIKTLLSFLREVTRSFGYTPVSVSST